MSPSRIGPLVLGLLAACAGSRPSAPAPEPAPASAPAPEPSSGAPATPEPAPPPPAKPNIDPGPRVRADAVIRPDSALASEPKRIAPPELAYARGLMALASTGVDQFQRAHPEADGRGILLAILDTGIDPTVPGLVTTSTGERKVIELRDFSGEGLVSLERATVRGDTVAVGGRRLAGYSRAAALGTEPPWGGVIREIGLGEPPASDLNGNGTVGDTLPVVVVRASDGWVLFADTDGDGSLANEKPIRDFAVAQETFGWHPRGRPAPLAVAANFSQTGDRPALDLCFDNSSHGTFVAGVAAGHDIYGVRGFDGVAPGAQLIGLKIANNAQGGITTTGSMIRALDYAIRFAERRRMPLVLNMSFGVGNEREGQARIDAMIDSVLAAHPGLVFAVSAGNDGPGISTVGFPGSAARVLTAGATLPGVFLPRSFGGPSPDQLASFSSRGGELPKPDVIAPGFAYSTVPRFDAGNEIKEGTSFSSPHVAGLVVRLQSALRAERLAADARTIKQALMVTARPQGDFAFIAEGAGVPDIGAALAWLRQRHAVPEVSVRPKGQPAGTAAYRDRGLASPADTLQAFEILRPTAGGPASFTLRSNAPWLVAPRSVSVSGASGSVTLRYRASALRRPGVYAGVVTGWTSDTLAGPAFRLVNTIVVPEPAASGELLPAARLEPGGERRASFLADSARPFVVRASTWSPLQAAVAYLHEPDGMPYRNGQQLEVGADSGAGVFRVDARDVVPGAYELVLGGFPVGVATVSARVAQAPFRVAARASGDAVTAALSNVTSAPVRARLGLAAAGAEREQPIESRGGDTVRIPLRAPGWARLATVDIMMDPAQWERFTDFGMTLVDSTGAQVGKLPLNYAVGRLRTAVSPTAGGLPLELQLFPGLAEPGSTEAWRARVTVRFYPDSAGRLAAAARTPTAVELGPRESRSVSLTAPAPVGPPGEGFRPLLVLVARVGEERWTREFAAQE